MGKRKRKDRNSEEEHLKKKIRKLEKRLQFRRRFEYSDTNSNSSIVSSPEPYPEDEDYYTRSEVSKSNNVRSIVNIVDSQHTTHSYDGIDKPTSSPQVRLPTENPYDNPIPSTSTQVEKPMGIEDRVIPPVPTDILEMLGDSKGKREVFGPKIQEEISKRWGRILCEGLNKDQRKELGEKILVPENFQLVKAPKLNPEIASVLTEPCRNRDKRLERFQNNLGLGISALTSLTSLLIDKDLDKLDIIKQLSTTSQLLLDLHYEDTQNRRKLVMYSLDKKFKDMIEDVQRDSMLFGENLSEKIKTSKSAEKSGLQIKKNNTTDASTSRKPISQPGNWKGPPRQSQRGLRRGGVRTRPSYQPSRKAPTTDRYQGPKVSVKPQSKPR
ncbi:hypothetical protein ACJJTC_011788 [Scirpophaga incertulas]